MAGHMGAKKVTIQNLKVISTDAVRGLIVVKGPVPGSKGSYVRIFDDQYWKTANWGKKYY